MAPPDEARARLERATLRMRGAQTHLDALEAAVSTLDGITGLEVAPPQATDVSTAADQAQAARTQAVDELRRLLLRSHGVVHAAQAALASLVTPAPRTSRTGYLLSLGELVGPPPDRTWRDEWVELNVEAFRLSGRHRFANAAHVEKNETPERWIGNFNSTIDGMVDRGGWPRPTAEVYCLLGSASNALTAALSERSGRYAACCYALCDALWEMHDPRQPLPPMYWHRTGEQSLTADDPIWSSLEDPDDTGCCGVTCRSLVLTARMPESFSKKGLATRMADGVAVKMVTVDSDIVCFESQPTDAFGAHTAVLTTSKGNGSFPPNTRFVLKEIKPPGTWEAPSDGRGLPLRPMQRLLVVTCTYQLPALDGSGRIAQKLASDAPKMACGAATLGFGRREAFACGLDGLTDKPLLTLAAEWDRPLAWSDGCGVEHTCRAEWAYVTGEASPLELPSRGLTRDAANGGKTPDAFLREANAIVAERRRCGYFSLPEDHAFLSLEEVLAVRLFSGAGYQPVNDFLRGIAATTGAQRRELARHAGLTFVATVGHLCAAIRKLADVCTPEEVGAPLWAGMRGAPPSSFWVPNTQAPVPELNAVTTAFLSTSRLRAEAIRPMQTAGSNVLWELQPMAEDDNGFHRGASIELLSQFACEGECLFPPGTMLSVRQWRPSEGAEGEEVVEESGKRFQRLGCTPTFL